MIGITKPTHFPRPVVFATFVPSPLGRLTPVRQGMVTAAMLGLLSLPVMAQQNTEYIPGTYAKPQGVATPDSRSVGTRFLGATASPSTDQSRRYRAADLLSKPAGTVYAPNFPSAITPVTNPPSNLEPNAAPVGAEPQAEINPLSRRWPTSLSSVIQRQNPAPVPVPTSQPTPVSRTFPNQASQPSTIQFAPAQPPAIPAPVVEQQVPVVVPVNRPQPVAVVQPQPVRTQVIDTVVPAKVEVVQPQIMTTTPRLEEVPQVIAQPPTLSTPRLDQVIRLPAESQPPTDWSVHAPANEPGIVTTREPVQPVIVSTPSSLRIDLPEQPAPIPTDVPPPNYLLDPIEPQSVKAPAAILPEPQAVREFEPSPPSVNEPVVVSAPASTTVDPWPTAAPQSVPGLIQQPQGQPESVPVMPRYETGSLTPPPPSYQVLTTRDGEQVLLSGQSAQNFPAQSTEDLPVQTYQAPEETLAPVAFEPSPGEGELIRIDEPTESSTGLVLQAKQPIEPVTPVLAPVVQPTESSALLTTPPRPPLTVPLPLVSDQSLGSFDSSGSGYSRVAGFAQDHGLAGEADALRNSLNPLADREAMLQARQRASERQQQADLASQQAAIDALATLGTSPPIGADGESSPPASMVTGVDPSLTPTEPLLATVEQSISSNMAIEDASNSGIQTASVKVEETINDRVDDFFTNLFKRPDPSTIDTGESLLVGDARFGEVPLPKLGNTPENALVEFNDGRIDLVINANAEAETAVIDSLATMVDRGMGNSRVVRAADARARGTGYLADSAFGALLPQVDLRYGVARETTSPSQKVDPNSGENLAVSTQTRSDANFSIKQKLFNADSLYDYGKLEKLSEADRLTAISTRQDAALELVDTYLQMLETNVSRVLTKQHVRRLAGLLTWVVTRAQSGGVPESEIDRVKARLLELRSSLAESEGQAQNALLRYARLVGVSPASLLIPQPNELVVIDQSADDIVANGLLNNASLAALRAKIEAVDEEIGGADARLLPQLDLEYINNAVSGAGGTETTTRDQRLQLWMSMNLFAGGSDMANKRALVEKRVEQQAAFDDAAEILMQDLRVAINTERVARERMMSAYAEAKSNIAVVNAFDQQLLAGSRQLTEVLDAYQRLHQSFLQTVRSWVTMYSASYQLLRLAGTDVALFVRSNAPSVAPSERIKAEDLGVAISVTDPENRPVLPDEVRVESNQTISESFTAQPSPPELIISPEVQVDPVETEPKN